MKKLSVPQKHQKAISLRTLRLSDVGVFVLGGQTKAEARAFLRSIDYSETMLARIERED